jgi:hypothetical protein
MRAGSGVERFEMAWELSLAPIAPHDAEGVVVTGIGRVHLTDHETLDHDDTMPISSRNPASLMRDSGLQPLPVP